MRAARVSGGDPDIGVSLQPGKRIGLAVSGGAHSSGHATENMPREVAALRALISRTYME